MEPKQLTDRASRMERSRRSPSDVRESIYVNCLRMIQAGERLTVEAVGLYLDTRKIAVTEET